MLNELFGVQDIMNRLTPRYAIFNFDYAMPGHFMYLWKEMALDGNENWTCMSWEYDLGLEQILQKSYESKHGHLVYAVYEKAKAHGRRGHDLYKLVATRDV